MDENWLILDMRKTRFVKTVALLSLLVAISIMPSCEKEPIEPSDTTRLDTTTLDTSGNKEYMEQMFALLVLDKKFMIKLAIDSAGINLTDTYDEHEIYLRKETFYKGPLEIYADGTRYDGTWESNDDYSRLNLEIEGLPEFEYYNTLWRFTHKSLDILKIAPVENPGQKQLHLVKP